MFVAVNKIISVCFVEKLWLLAEMGESHSWIKGHIWILSELKLKF